MADATQTADYIIVGGGLTGCALASRLSLSSSSPSVTILEAGVDATGHPHVKTALEGFKLAGTDLDWNLKTQPEPNTSNRSHTFNAGKVLGGGSMLNYGGWQRADAADYEDWSKAVGDDRWGYKSFLPYLRKTEKFFDATNEARGLDGPFHVSPVTVDPKRKYGLREPMRQAWEELGVQQNPKALEGSNNGLTELLENWNYGQRQPSHLAYDLSRVQVVTSALVQKISFSNESSTPAATEVVLVDGRHFRARKEIILSAGALCTPQLLMLSGIGPPETLAQYAIPAIVTNEEVGKSLADHFALFQMWKVKDPSQGLSIGNPQWTDPTFFTNMPWDWLVNETVPAEQLKRSMDKDESDGKLAHIPFHAQSLADPARSHVETMVLYTAFPPMPFDGSLITTSIMLTLPT